MIFTVTPDNDGKLLRDYLRGGCGISRNLLVKLKKLDGGIRLNGTAVTVRAVIKTGDVVELADADRTEDENPYLTDGGVLPEIVYEDEALIAFNKPADMPTHTSRGHRENCLANSVSGYFHEKGQPFVFRAVNRLDRDTSGTVMVAKNKYYASKLSESLQNGDFRKVYLAVLDGEVPERGKIEGYIKRQAESIIKRVMCCQDEPGAAYSLTRYERLGLCNGKSLVKVYPQTGRTHQIRLHFSSIGAPVCGDALYGSASDAISRQALHALSLTFPSPTDGNILTVTAKPAEDIINLIEKYFLIDILSLLA